jgi:hypothetical protein
MPSKKVSGRCSCMPCSRYSKTTCSSGRGTTAGSCSSALISLAKSRRPPDGDLRVVERLDAEVVAAEHEPARTGRPPEVGDRVRPHAVEAGRAVVAPLLVGVDDDLGVGLRGEGVAQLLELGAQLAVVVDLAVEDEPDRLVLVGDRLVAAGPVDDGEPAVPETHAVALERAPPSSGPRCRSTAAIRPRSS